MKSGLEMVLDIAKLLMVPQVLNELDGNIWQHQRPANSRQTDIVVNSLALTNQQVQQGVVNVNIHVPNTSFTEGGVSDHTMPDLKAMKRIEAVVYPLLEAYEGVDFHTNIDEPGQPFQDGANWYLNIRVNYYSFQENYQNI